MLMLIFLISIAALLFCIIKLKLIVKAVEKRYGNE